MSTYIVGDIQGCYDGLQQLLSKVGFEKGRDTLWAVGDLVARGPDSLKTVQYLYSLKDSFQSVLGNHDLHFLAVTQGLKQAKESDNLTDLLADKNLPYYIDWLRNMPLATKIKKNTLIVHAGLYPKWSFKLCVSNSKEIEAVLQGDNWVSLLEQMYGSEPRIWKKSLEGLDRQRFIINAMTRMRYLDENFALDFAQKCTPENAPSNLIPWFEVTPNKRKSSQKVIFGHWAALMGETGLSNVIGLDTGYVWGNTFSCLDLEKGEVIQVSAS